MVLVQAEVAGGRETAVTDIPVEERTEKTLCCRDTDRLRQWLTHVNGEQTFHLLANHLTVRPDILSSAAEH